MYNLILQAIFYFCWIIKQYISGIPTVNLQILDKIIYRYPTRQYNHNMKNKTLQQKRRKRKGEGRERKRWGGREGDGGIVGGVGAQRESREGGTERGAETGGSGGGGTSESGKERFKGRWWLREKWAKRTGGWKSSKEESRRKKSNAYHIKPTPDRPPLAAFMLFEKV